jgi:mono/diheme cytochrome c family protein
MLLVASFLGTFLSAVLGGAASQNLVNGKMVYEKNCLACHGPNGKGDGYTKFNPPVADLSSAKIQTMRNAEVFKTIHDGRVNTAMGSWKFELTDEEIRDVIAYIKSFKR